MTAVDQTLGEFVSALRKAEVDVSPAETLDAMAAVDLIGLQDKQKLRRTLSIVLAKTPEEKAQFDICFQRFFSFEHFEQPPEALQRLREDALAIRTEQGGGGSLDAPATRPRRGAADGSPLGDLLVSGDAAALSLALARAAQAVNLSQIRTLRERGLFAHRILVHMGISRLEWEIDRLGRSENPQDHATAVLLTRARAYLTEEVTRYVENQYLNLVDGTGDRFIAEAVSQARLSAMQVYYFDHIREAVRKLANRLIKKHARRRKVQKRGQLDIRKTLRRNLAYEGTPFDLHWKQVKVEKPKIFVLCDVSGSVRNVARFLLTFLYSLNELLPRVRSFAFAGELGEITALFEQYPLAEAIEMSLNDYGKGSTDYGLAFRQFADLCLGELDSRSTVIVLGDSRNNYYGNGADVLKSVSEKTRQLIWLNPEPRALWREGDAEMPHYLPHCHVAEVCNSLKDLERIVGQVLRTNL